MLQETGLSVTTVCHEVAMVGGAGNELETKDEKIGWVWRGKGAGVILGTLSKHKSRVIMTSSESDLKPSKNK